MSYYNYNNRPTKLGLPIREGNYWETYINFTPFQNAYQSHGLNSYELGFMPLQNYNGGLIPVGTGGIKPIPKGEVLTETEILPNELGKGKNPALNPKPLTPVITPEIKNELANIQKWIKENKITAGAIALIAGYLIIKK